MYIPGRFRTASSPSRAVMLVWSYVGGGSASPGAAASVEGRVSVVIGKGTQDALRAVAAPVSRRSGKGWTLGRQPRFRKVGRPPENAFFQAKVPLFQHGTAWGRFLESCALARPAKGLLDQARTGGRQ